ncbi:MAG: 3'(2'),5'-bisphosphate nucleotidase CysQ [Hyphomicrobiales bacterium]
MSTSQDDSFSDQDLATMVELFEALALEAGSAIMPYYTNGCETMVKEDESPVTAADHAAEEIILLGLRKQYPNIPVIAEEEMCAGHMPAALGQYFFLVDPLDGTKEFINKRSDFTVNIALIEFGVPIAGTVYSPVRGEVFSGFGDQATETVVEDGSCGKKVKISVKGRVEAKIAVASRSHLTPETEQFLTDHGISECVSVGSSLKFCLLARGEADIYPRFGRTMEWDTAAGDAVLRAAGGRTLNPDGSQFIYGKQNQTHDAPFANPSFIAFATRVA